MSESERLAELARRRGLFFPSNAAYGGTAGFYTYGPTGAAIKRKVEREWRRRFTVREGHMEINSPTVMPESVFEASGHLAGFDDMIIECGDCGRSYRADHVVEDMTAITDAESYTPEGIMDIILEYDLECRVCGASFADRRVEEFNLMFATHIGPGASAPGYLRPETAQGIFVEFPRLKDYARGQLPFGVTQIGSAYRNEISPRRGLIRLREFTQAELELFIDPEKDEPRLETVSDVTLPLYPATEQSKDNGGIVEKTVVEAVNEGIITNSWIGYYLGVTKEWCARIGIDMDRFRYRQHLTGERAHYAADCWDAETEIDEEWIEVAGFAYRSDYDLQKHGEYSNEEFTVFKQFDEPVSIERPTIDPDMSYFGPKYGDNTESIIERLDDLADREPEAFDDETIDIQVGGEAYTIPVAKTGFHFESDRVTGERVTPHVVEPSFGVDRLIYSILIHAYREDEIEGESRSRLRLPNQVAPTFVGVFPLMDRDGLDKEAGRIAERLRMAGFSVAYDDSGSIGRRYRRQDEVGTPYCVTIDYQTIEEDTVTVRDRDTAVQRRVAVDELPGILTTLREDASKFNEIGVEIADA